MKNPEEIARLNALLKPCPFCGSPCELDWTPVPDFSKEKTGGKDIAWSVRCTSVGSRCPMSNHWLCSTSDAAITAWNKRALESASLPVLR